MKTLMNPKNLCLSLTSLCLLAGANSVLAEDWTYSLKAGVANLPRYSGSDERMTAPYSAAPSSAPGGFSSTLTRAWAGATKAMP